MTTSTPLVSIVMPCYNSAAFLERTLQSIVGQSYRHWELLVVDDGSSDSTANITIRFSEQDRRISFYTRPEKYKRGGRGAKNYGFTLCRGMYVVFFDSDDYMLENYLAERVHALLNNTNIDVVFSDFGWKVPSNLIPEVLYKYHKDFNQKYKQLRYTEAFWKSFLDLNFFWVPSNIMWKKSSINSFRWNESTTIGEDFEYNTQAILNGLQFYCLHRVTWYYMRNENSMIATSETPEQLDKRSLFLYLVGSHLKENDFIKNTDRLLVHILKHQYRIIRRICLVEAPLKNRKDTVNSVIPRLVDLISEISLTNTRDRETQKLKKLKYIVAISLFTRRGYVLFERFLIGKKTYYGVLPSEFFRIMDN